MTDNTLFWSIIENLPKKKKKEPKDSSEVLNYLTKGPATEFELGVSIKGDTKEQLECLLKQGLIERKSFKGERVYRVLK